MPGTYAPSPGRAKGSWAPRLAGVAVVVVLAGGVLAVYLGTHGHAPGKAAGQDKRPALSGKVVSMQTVGVIDFGPYDDGDPSRGNPHGHPLMLTMNGSSVDFVGIPVKEITSGTPQWTADQMSDGSEIFIYVPNGKCLSPQGDQLQLTHCNLGLAQRWRTLHSKVMLGQTISQYANAKTGACLTAPRRPGPAKLATCGKALTKTQEIALWWSA
ncbi:MAG TPA: hypothetical protein VMA95_02075 [Streptosporangiaceae bacterium]|nr:hypothetical protein [Streptosporangiaceae bacterium]